MSRYSKLFAFSAAALMTVACARTARIDAVISDADSLDIVVKVLDVNRFEVLDTVALDANGKFTYKVEVKKGQPEFVYLFNGDTKLASMILSTGDRVSVVADTTGRYTIEGSEESLKLAQVEQDYAKALARITALARRVEESVNADYALGLRQQMGKEYVDYYRSRVRYVMDNSRSLSVIPVFYQTFGPDFPVFGQVTDAIHFRNIADSLSLVYPDSKYVKTLRQEADRRFGYLEFEARMNAAEPISYPQIELPDIKGEKTKLTDVEAKVVMVHFWTATDAQQKMFNLDVLMPLYEKFHAKGFEIYQVSLDVDKGLWAQVVKEQKLPWISVCDANGAASVYARNYNISALPAFYIIADGELVDGSVVDESSLRKVIADSLK